MMNSGSRSSYDSNLTDSLSSIKDGTGFLADTPGGSSSSTSMPEGAREAFAKKRFNSYSGLSYDSSRVNSAPNSLTDDWDFEESGLEQVNVVTRVRPLSEAEKKRGDKDCVKIQHNSSSVTLGNVDKSKTFTFSAILDSQTTQREVLEKCGMMQMIEMAVDGYSCTAFAYGQTGSGKTYTITGPVSQESVMPTEDKYGLIQRSFSHLFEVLKQRSSPSITFTLSASYLEIYNEQVKDLLNPSGRGSLPVRWSKEKGFYVENLFIVDCETLDDLLAVLEEGMSQRQIATNNINEYSSRSHTLVSLQIDSEMPDPEESTLYITKHGRLSFVDLAGSEKVKELGNSGELLTETTNINKSLLTLGNCISALSDNRKRSGHIPYRDSKLTKLLADSLGGSGITLMIACITPSAYCLSESLSTLRYANRAKRIKNKPVIRMDPREQLILSLKREIKLLRNENIYLRQCLEFPRSDKPLTMRRNDTEQSLPRFNSDDSLSGNKTPIPGDFDRTKGKSDTSLNRGEKRERTLSSFTPKSAADSSLYEMLQEYMVENEKLRSENSDLHNVRERAMTEHEHLSKENDKLLTKLDQLERVFAASPISMSRTVSGVSSSSASQRIRSHSQDSSASPTTQQGQRATGSGSSQGSAALLQSPDWQLGGRVDPPGGSGGIDRHKMGFDASSNLDQMGQLPPVDSKKGVPNGYRSSNSHPPLHAPALYQQPSPPYQYRSHDPQQHSVHQQTPTHQSFPPSKSYHGQASIKSKHALPEGDSSSPRELTKPRHSQSQANKHPAAIGDTTQGRPRHNVDIYIPSIQPTGKETNKETAAKTDTTSPRWDNSHGVQDRQGVKAIKKPPNKTEGAKAAPLAAPSSQAVTGYSNRSKKIPWAQGKSGANKTSPKTQRKEIADSASSQHNLDALPHTPAATPPPVKYRPKGTSDLLAATSGDLTKPPPNQESLQEINEKLRQELLDLDGEIQYMKYVNKAKVNNNTAATTKTGIKGKRR